MSKAALEGVEVFPVAVTTEEAEAADIPGALARITREEAEAAHSIPKQPIQQRGMEMQMARFEFLRTRSQLEPPNT